MGDGHGRSSDDAAALVDALHGTPTGLGLHDAVSGAVGCFSLSVGLGHAAMNLRGGAVALDGREAPDQLGDLAKERVGRDRHAPAQGRHCRLVRLPPEARRHDPRRRSDRLGAPATGLSGRCGSSFWKPRLALSHRSRLRASRDSPSLHERAARRPPSRAG